MIGANWLYLGLPKAQKRGPVADLYELTGARARSAQNY
jgi:hypothetical protein